MILKKKLTNYFHKILKSYELVSYGPSVIIIISFYIDDYDIMFPIGSGTYHVDMGILTTSLSALTLTCWIKANVGPSHYRLLSYILPGSITAFEVSLNVVGNTAPEKGLSIISVKFPSGIIHEYAYQKCVSFK